ncbi:MAG TPA: FtsX-like permease family protein, partial [Chitinophagaceae bacterium]|nr:FtsX-like permease family protein [Chitinophagaceae bacterium]
KNWFDVFHYDFVRGNAAGFLRDPFSILLTQSAAKRYFGKQDPIGQAIKIDSITYQVKAIVKDNPTNSSFQFEMLIPVDALIANPQRRKNDAQWSNFNYLTFIQLHETANPAVVADKLTKLVHKHKKDDDITISLTKMRDMHFETQLTSATFLQVANRKTVYIFSVMSVILLLIACINYVNLTTAKASLRAKEVSIKKIIGANRWSLFRQFFMESFLVSLFALVLALALIAFLLPMFNRLTERTFVFSITSPNIWPVLLITLGAATLLNGIYPAALLSSFEPLKVFKGITVLKIKDTTLRKSLVVLQFTLSVALITATIVVSKQLKYIQEKDMGYDREQVFTFEIPFNRVRHYTPEAKAALFASIKHELLSNTSIERVSLASDNIVNLTSTHSGSTDWDGRDPDFKPTVYPLSADTDFQKTFGLAMKEGRWFDPNNKTDEHNFILNETAVNEFNIRKPVIGQRFTFQGDTGQIIGIVKDFNFQSLHAKIGPMVILNDAWKHSFFVKTKPFGAKNALAAAEKIWSRIVPTVPLNYTFLDDRFDSLYKAEQKVSLLIKIFAIIAILITSLGLLGLIAFSTEQRVREIGIRKVLGATVSHILVLVTKDFVRLIIIGIFIAVPLAWWAMSSWLEDFAYRIQLDAWIFILSAVAALLVAMVTISFQAFKSAVKNPVENLRTE